MVKRKALDKRYVYLRDNQRCYYCGKPLKPGQMTMDHYQPRSEGGTDDYFNLVSSCRLCNKYKKNIIPVDKDMVHLKLFHRAWKDNKLVWAVKGFKKMEPQEIISKVYCIVCKADHSIAKNNKQTLFIKNNVIFRMDGDRLNTL
ncbi:MAG: HNH endonuclease [Bacillota bacterium]